MTTIKTSFNFLLKTLYTIGITISLFLFPQSFFMFPSMIFLSNNWQTYNLLIWKSSSCELDSILEFNIYLSETHNQVQIFNSTRLYSRNIVNSIQNKFLLPTQQQQLLIAIKVENKCLHTIGKLLIAIKENSNC